MGKNIIIIAVAALIILGIAYALTYKAPTTTVVTNEEGETHGGAGSTLGNILTGFIG